MLFTGASDVVIGVASALSASASQIISEGSEAITHTATAIYVTGQGKLIIILMTSIIDRRIFFGTSNIYIYVY